MLFVMMACSTPVPKIGMGATVTIRVSCYCLCVGVTAACLKQSVAPCLFEALHALASMFRWLVFVKGVASVEARLSSFRHVDRLC